MGMVPGAPSPTFFDRSALESKTSPDPRLQAPQVAPDPSPPDRKVIFTGSLLIQVPDPESLEKSIRAIAEGAQGWIHKVEGTVLTLRIVSAEFHTVMERLAALGKVMDRKVSGTDVTEEYRDLQVRIENADQVRKRLVALLEKANDVKAALEVERELARLTEEIERFKGRLRWLADQIQYSTIVVDLRRTIPPAYEQPQVAFPFPWIREIGLEGLLHFRE
jgi:hypothetical protein